MSSKTMTELRDDCCRVGLWEVIKLNELTVVVYGDQVVSSFNCEDI